MISNQNAEPAPDLLRCVDKHVLKVRREGDWFVEANEGALAALFRASLCLLEGDLRRSPTIIQTYVPDGEPVRDKFTDPRICELVVQASAQAIDAGWEQEGGESHCRIWGGALLDEDSVQSFWLMSIGPTDEGIYVYINYIDFG